MRIATSVAIAILDFRAVGRYPVRAIFLKSFGCAHAPGLSLAGSCNVAGYRLISVAIYHMFVQHHHRNADDAMAHSLSEVKNSVYGMIHGAG